MPPKASTSAKGGQSKGKLSPIEQQLLDLGSQAPNRVSNPFSRSLLVLLTDQRRGTTESRRLDRLNYSRNVV